MGAFVVTSHANILLQAWDFAASPAGEAPNSANIVRAVPDGPHFTVGGSGQVTENGTLRISPTEAFNAHLDVHHIKLSPGYDSYRLEFVIGGWDWSYAFENGQTRRLSLGFAGNFNTTTWGPNNNFDFAAGGSIRMNASGQILFTSEAGVENQTNVIAEGFGPVQTTPIYLRIDVDAVARTRSVTFSHMADFSNDPIYTHSGQTGLSRVTPDGALNRIRIGPLDGDAPGYWNGDWATIDSITYSMIPEPSTYAMIFGLYALGAAFTYRRRKNRA